MSTTETATTRTGAITAPPSGYRAFFIRLHFYAGLFVGPFVLVAAITGGLYAIAPSLEQRVYRDYLHVESQGAFEPVAEQIRAAQRVVPDLPVTAVRPASAPGDTTRVLFDDPALGDSERRAVFIDPVTARSLGELTAYGSSGALPVRTWIDNLHRSMHLGDPGRLYSELAASWLWLIALAGGVLWISRYRRIKGRRPDAARVLTVDRTARGVARTLNWHGAVGIWIAAGLLFLSATGLTWSTYAGENVTKLRAALSWTTPTLSTALTAGKPGATTQPDHADHLGHGAPAASESSSAATPLAAVITQVDGVIAAARAAGIDGRVEVGLPKGPDKAFTVAQTRQPWVMSNNAVAVDGATGTVTDTSWFADWPLAAKLSAWGIQLHMGTLFGLPNQLVMLALACALVSVVIRGYLMWWRRRPTTPARRVGSPPPRGGLTSLPPGAAVVVVVAATAIGWFVPLFGLSLVAFLAADVAAGAVQQNRAADTGCG